MDLQRYLYDVANTRRRQLIPLLYTLTQGRVQSGPFHGMTIVPHFMWGDADVCGKLLGVYEDELHSYIQRAIDQMPDVVVNIGSAEGYYAVGLATRLACPVIACDTDPRALDIALVNAEANDVTLSTHGEVTPETLQVLIEDYQHPLLIVDCEGYENVLLDPVLVPELSRASILVETHDCLDRGITERLTQRMGATHMIECIEQSGKNPYQFPFLRGFSDCDKWCLVHEGRPESGYWLWMEPK